MTSDWWRAAHGVAWVGTGALVAAAVLRVVAADRGSTYFVLLAGLTPVLYLPAWAIAVGAFGAKRWPLLAVAMALVIAHCVWLVPLVAGGRGPLAGPVTHVRVLALNLHADSATGPATQRLIDRTHPDVVVLSEASRTSTAGLRLDAYPSVWSELSTETKGWLIASRWPIVDRRVVGLADRTMPRVVVRRPDGGSLVVWQTHPMAPIVGWVAFWRRQLGDIRAAVRPDLGGADPVIVAGDFNATRDMPAYARLLDDGWADALDGRGLLATWRAGGRFLPVVLRLDHVLVSRQVGVRRVERAAVGSDHLGVIVDLDVPADGGR